MLIAYLMAFKTLRIAYLRLIRNKNSQNKHMFFLPFYILLLQKFSNKVNKLVNNLIAFHVRLKALFQITFPPEAHSILRYASFPNGSCYRASVPNFLWSTKAQTQTSSPYFIQN